MTPPARSTTWLCGGQNFYPAMLAAIARAQRSVVLETYIFAEDTIGWRFLDALVAAAKRGVQVRLLVDDYGSLERPGDFFQPLIAAGGAVQIFNPLRFHRFGVRDHRKLLVCDGAISFIGGANLADDYDGDGFARGWFDTVTRCEDPALAATLTAEFDRLFLNADFATARRRKLRLFRPLRQRGGETQVLAVKPGRGAGSFQRTLQSELANAHSADFVTPYFLPGRRLRRLLFAIVKRGGRVRLILPAKSDVPVARRAGMIFYARLLRAGVELYEFQPQVLHAKLYCVDGQVFAGSSNLDVRSFKLNYELMLRFTDPVSVTAAREIFERALQHSQRIGLKEFRRQQNFWERWKNRWAHFLVARIDPFFALRHFR